MPRVEVYLSKVLKLLVFDLDGTLADTRHDLAFSVNHALRACGHAPLPLTAVIGFVGDGARNLIHRSLAAARGGSAAPGSGSGSVPGSVKGLESKVLLGAVPENEVDAALKIFMEHYKSHCLGETQAYPGVKASLDKLSGYAKAVLTNKPAAPARAILSGLELAAHFRHVLGGDNPHGRKPSPAGLKHIMSAEDAAPGETVLIGDGVQDMQAARGAGAHFLAFLGGMGSAEALLAGNPGDVFEDMNRLPEALAALEAKLITAGARI
jgi:phosphoglycolate phosphatase